MHTDQASRGVPPHGPLWLWPSPRRIRPRRDEKVRPVHRARADASDQPSDELDSEFNFRNFTWHLRERQPRRDVRSLRTDSLLQATENMHSTTVSRATSPALDDAGAGARQADQSHVANADINAATVSASAGAHGPPSRLEPFSIGSVPRPSAEVATTLHGDDPPLASHPPHALAESDDSASGAGAQAPFGLDIYTGLGEFSSWSGAESLGGGLLAEWPGLGYDLDTLGLDLGGVSGQDEALDAGGVNAAPDPLARFFASGMGEGSGSFNWMM